ncbi:apolipoprotein D-like [Asterias amurensis]|uniref:apolipoprotein D-like n=1 Tax=Asterias amurensis TaxID=7602 RepID=UPI003AB7525D
MKSGATVILGLVLAGLVACSQAQVFSWGRCPTVEVKNDFNTTAYFGRWFEILRFENTRFEEGSRCIHAEYSAGDDGQVKVVNSAIDEATGEPNSVEGYAYAPNPEVPAKLKVQFGESFFAGNYWVLDTDYETFSMVHSCTGLFFFNFQINWLLSPTQTLESGAVQDALRKFEDAGIDVSRFIESNQRGCPEF